MSRPTHTQNLALIARFQSGDRTAGDALVRANAGLVKLAAQAAMGYRGCLEYEDLEQEGRIGMMIAARRFDPSRGFTFSTYAMFWVKATIRRAVENTGPMIRIPVARRLRAVRAADYELLDDPLSLDFVVSDEGAETTMGELLCDAQPGPEDQVIDAVAVDQILDAADLHPRERLVVELRFGLLDGCERTLREVGGQVGLSREGVRHIEARAIERLREAAR